MAYLVLARKYRPQLFVDLVGQEPISQTLRNAIRNGRIAHSFLFSGPRGVGKTSAARILAKAVNCLNREKNEGEPCNACDACREITSGSSLDVVEIDGASNRGIDEIRNLRENVKYSPARYVSKIYIIDEVHMLTKEAFNALLKTLEEPPEHVIFIFATTEPHNVPTTILSRCQRYDFKRIPPARIAEHLRSILGRENVPCEEQALLEIARSSSGSLRDSETLLDQLIVFGGGRITAADVEKSLGLVRTDVYAEFLSCVLSEEREPGLLLVQRLNTEGVDFLVFFNGLVEFLRSVMVVQNLDPGRAAEILNLAAGEMDAVNAAAAGLPPASVLSMLDAVIESEKDLKWSPFPRIFAEMMYFKLADIARGLNLRSLNSQVQDLKRRIDPASAGAAPASAPRAVPTTPAPAASTAPAAQTAAAAPSPPSPAVAGPAEDSGSTLVENSAAMFKKYLPRDDQKKKPFDLTLETIGVRWGGFLLSLSDPRLSLLKTFERCCALESLNENCLTISLNSRTAFETIVKPDVIDSLQKALREYLPAPTMTVKFVYREPPPKVPAPQPPGQEQPRQQAGFDQVYRKAVNILGGSFLEK